MHVVLLCVNSGAFVVVASVVVVLRNYQENAPSLPGQRLFFRLRYTAYRAIIRRGRSLLGSRTDGV